jgi:hypothetical protein
VLSYVVNPAGTNGSYGLLQGDSLAVQRLVGSNVGSYSFDNALAENKNYTITADNPLLVINPRPITVTADNLTKVYGDADPALTYSVALTSGSTGPALLPGDSLSGSLTRAPGSDVSASPYTIFANGLTNPNYAVTPVNGSLQITPRPVTVLADAKTKVYGDADPALTYTVAADGVGTSRGLAAGDSLDVAVSRAAGTNAGNYAATASVVSNPNYSVTTTEGSFTIAPRPVTLSVTTQTKVYGQEDPATLSYTINPDGVAGSRGVVDGESLLIGRAAGSGVGTYAADTTNPANSNYQISVDNPLLTITPRAITVAVDSKAKVYGDTDPALTYVVQAGPDGGLVQGDTLSGSLSRTLGNNVGTYAITASLTNANYAITPTSGVLTINPRPIIVQAEAKTKVFGEEADPQLTYTVLPNGSITADRLDTSRGLVTGDTLSISLSRAQGDDAGSYKIDFANRDANTPRYLQQQPTNPNYLVRALEGTLRVTPRPVRVVAQDATRTFGEENPEFVYTAERSTDAQTAARGLLGEDQVSGVLATVANSTSASGIYGITQGTVAASRNYALEYQAGKLTVEPRVFAQASQAIQSVSSVTQAAVPVAGPSIGGLATSASVPIRTGAGQAPATLQAPSAAPAVGTGQALATVEAPSTAPAVGAGEAPATVEAPSSTGTTTTVSGGEGQQLAVQAPRAVAGGVGQSLGTIEAPTSLVPLTPSVAASAASSGVAVSGGSILLPASPAIAVAPATVGNLSVVAVDTGVGDVASAITAGGGASAGLPRVFVTGGGISLSAALTPTSGTSEQ